MEIDPTVELAGQKLREAILYCLEWGLTSIGNHQGQDRMAERGFTDGEIIGALKGGVLRTSEKRFGNWRYTATRNDLQVVFTFDLDEDGNMLVIVTLVRKE